MSDAVAADLHGVLVAALRVDRAADLLAEDFQLIDSGGSFQVRGDHERALGAGEEHLGHFAAGGGLSGALQAGHEEDGGAGCDKGNLWIDRSHELDQFVVNQLDHDVGGPKGLDDFGADGLLLHFIAELARYFEVDVGFEEGGAYFTHHLGDVFLGDLSPTAQAAKNAG